MSSALKSHVWLRPGVVDAAGSPRARHAPMPHTAGEERCVRATVRPATASGMRDFLDIHGALILRLARFAVRGAEPWLDAGDVAHEVVVALLRMHADGSFDPARVEQPEAYLRVVVRNAASRARSRSRRGGELTREGDLEALADGSAARDVAAPSPEDLARHALDARCRLDALKSKLRPRDAVAFALLVEDGLAIDEVASALGTTANNVYQIRHRILAAARELAGDDDPSRGPARVVEVP